MLRYYFLLKWWIVMYLISLELKFYPVCNLENFSSEKHCFTFVQVVKLSLKLSSCLQIDQDV